jgi:hypothetical protein
LAHVGGSDDALSMLRTGRYALDLDQFYNDAAYWRSNDRYAPHNMYTDTESLDNLENSKGKISSDFKAWPRQDGQVVQPIEPTEDNPTPDNPEFANQIDLPVSIGQFAVSYTFSAETNKYLRYQGDVAHLDNNGQQIAPDVVIALMVNFRATGDAKAHNEIDTIGNGTAYIFQNGIVTEAKWRKDTAGENIRFLDENDEEISLNRGQTWLTAIDKNKTVTWN